MSWSEALLSWLCMLDVCACARTSHASFKSFSYMYQIHPGKKPLVHQFASESVHLFAFAGFVWTGNCTVLVYVIVSLSWPSASVSAASVHPVPCACAKPAKTE